MDEYTPNDIEAKWQRHWVEQALFSVENDDEKPKKYVLDMFPYPSGEGLHVGHVKIYTAADVLARYYRMRGFSVLHPTGWDAFGLPTENSAIKFGIHPAALTKRNVDRFRQQMQRMGWSYDWQREVNTTDPTYYRWTQWIFLQLFKKGLAYEATVPINWCPSCKTGLANEEVIDGKCERCGTPVEQKPLRQWMLKITAYAEELLQGLDSLDWPDFIIDMQRNWIGRSEGAEITFAVTGTQESLVVYTTRPDTLYGATYVVVAPEHPLVAAVTAQLTNNEAVAAYVEAARHKTELERQTEEKEKTGVCLEGVAAVHPLTGDELPIFVADYVLQGYGTGAIMAVPAHDVRDYAFAQQFGLPITPVVAGEDEAAELPYVGFGQLVNSDRFTGMDSEAAAQEITEALEARGVGKQTVNYKLRDWVFSRQRYWGEPIPLIHCEACGVVPVPEDELPVTLPEVERYEPTGTGESPLAAVTEWVQVACPECGKMAQRETNTMPQWAGSSWYFLRYPDPQNEMAVASAEALARWMPVDMYIGGAEHAVLHLLYARFWHKVLAELGVVKGSEPFQSLHNVGLVLGGDGQKMSKSRGNVVNPDDEITRYGADTTRVFACFMGPFEDTAVWSTQGIAGSHRFMKRLWKTLRSFIAAGDWPEADTDEVRLKLEQTIQRVTESTESLRFNTAISALMEWLNTIESEKRLSQAAVEKTVLLLSPYAPHLAEELWEQLGQKESLAYEAWPQVDAAVLAAAYVTIPVQVNGKVRGSLEVDPGTSQAAIEQLAKEIPNVQRHLDGVVVTRVVFVPDRLLNFVVATE